MADEEGQEMAEEEVDQEAMMAEWEAMADAEEGGEDEDDPMAAAMGGGSSRVLDQSEIDSLLGVDDGDGSDEDGHGIKAILNSALVSYERLPMLEVVFDRLVRMMSTSLRNFTSDNVEVSLDNITSARFGDYLNSIPLPAMLAVFKAEEWDNYGLMVVDSALIYSIVDVLLGGRRGTAAMRIEGRPYTTIERNLVERMMHVVLSDLSAAFDPLSPVTFRFERLETNPRFAAIARHGNAAIVTKLRIDMEDRGGRIELVLPYATIEPVRELLLQMFMGEKFGRDSIWEGHLTAELWQTEVHLQGVLDTVELKLGDILNWTVGSRLELNSSPDSKVDLHCGEAAMFNGNMGRRNGQIAVRIADKADPPNRCRGRRMELLPDLRRRFGCLADGDDHLRRHSQSQADRAAELADRNGKPDPRVCRSDTAGRTRRDGPARAGRAGQRHAGRARVGGGSPGRGGAQTADDLAFMIDRGGRLADRLEHDVSASIKKTDARASAPVAAASESAVDSPEAQLLRTLDRVR